MTKKAANALYRYFETLYNLNQSLITLCGIDVIDNPSLYEKYIEDIIHMVPRLVPYVCSRKTGEYVIESNDGLLEYLEEIPFLLEAYNSLLSDHYEFLAKTKKVRNKLEHKMQGANIIASGSSSMILFDATFEVGKEFFEFNAAEIINCVKDINVIFSKIQDLVDRFSFSTGKEDHPYYHRLIRYRFSEFNKIYDSPLLRTFGRALLPF